VPALVYWAGMHAFGVRLETRAQGAGSGEAGTLSRPNI
jgi:hypothetical protein